jgi:hypothetical protein
MHSASRCSDRSTAAHFLRLTPVSSPLHTAWHACLVKTGSVTMQDAIVWPNGIPPAGITHKEDFGNHILSISHREKDGRAELHETKADVMIVQSGEATLVYGGHAIEPQPTAPKEIQGSGFRGRIKAAPGSQTKPAMSFTFPPANRISFSSRQASGSSTCRYKSSIRPTKNR